LIREIYDMAAKANFLDDVLEFLLKFLVRFIVKPISRFSSS
jgi:hypothetical protein